MQLRHSFPTTKLPGSGLLCVLQTNPRPNLHERLPSSPVGLDLMWHKLIPTRSASRGEGKDNKYIAFIGYQADTDRVAVGITAIILRAQPNGRRIKQLKQQTWKIHETLIVGQVRRLRVRVYTQSDSCVCAPICFSVKWPRLDPIKTTSDGPFSTLESCTGEGKLALILKQTAALKSFAHTPGRMAWLLFDNAEA